MKKEILNNKLTFLVLILSSLAGVFYLRTLTPVLTGDGKDYVLQMIAFQNHFSFGVTVDDAEQAKAEFYNEADGLHEEYYDNPWNHMHEYGDAKYSNHYGAYSALVVPIKLIVTLFGAYPVWAFYLANFILYISALLVTFFALKTSVKKKLILTLLIAANPVVFYLGWTHSEVYLFAFTVIGLIFYYKKSYGWAILFLCIGAMQNVGILPFAMMVGIEFIAEKVIKYRTENQKFVFSDFIRKNALKIVPYGLCYLPGLLPIVSTYFRFQKINLVANNARESNYLIHKAFDYAFDLNLGIFPYEPFVLILFIIMVIIGIKKCTLTSVTNLLGVGGMFFVIANQRQINCGMQYIMRYNVWIIPMMIFFVVMEWDVIWKSEKHLLSIGLLETCFTTFLIFFLIMGNGNFPYLQFAPWTKAIMDHYPYLYNPTHGIFYSRATGIESYYEPDPVIYATKDGKIKKILLSREAEKIFYSNDYKLYDAEGNLVDKSLLNSHMTDKGDYKYINTTDDIYYPNEYTLGDTIYFYSDQYNADAYVQCGLSNREEWGTWTDGDELIMLFHVDDNASLLNASIDVASTFYQEQEINIKCNNEFIYHAVLEGASDIEFSFLKPESGVIVMQIEVPDSVRPAEVMDSTDRRDLGIGLLTMTISEGS